MYTFFAYVTFVWLLAGVSAHVDNEVGGVGEGAAAVHTEAVGVQLFLVGLVDSGVRSEPRTVQLIPPEHYKTFKHRMEHSESLTLTNLTNEYIYVNTW